MRVCVCVHVCFVCVRTLQRVCVCVCIRTSRRRSVRTCQPWHSTNARNLNTDGTYISYTPGFDTVIYTKILREAPRPLSHILSPFSSHSLIPMFLLPPPHCAHMPQTPTSPPSTPRLVRPSASKPVPCALPLSPSRASPRRRQPRRRETFCRLK